MRPFHCRNYQAPLRIYALHVRSVYSLVVGAISLLPPCLDRLPQRGCCFGSWYGFALCVSQFSDGIEDRVVVGSLDLNQCRWLPDEIAGKKPEVLPKNLNLIMDKLTSFLIYRGSMWILGGHTWATYVLRKSCIVMELVTNSLKRLKGLLENGVRETFNQNPSITLSKLDFLKRKSCEMVQG